MARQKIIIGIHGLGNKPPEILLEEWWRLAIHEGLTSIGCPRDKIDFELVYWADILNKKLLDPEETDIDSDFFLEEKYNPVKTNKFNSKLKNSLIQKVSDTFNGILFNKKIHSNFPSVTDWVIKHFFKELDIYLAENCVTEESADCLAQEVIREKLRSILEKHQNKDILLISHSMGTIIAYDVLSKYQDSIKINTFITCGSPLGVPFIFEKVRDKLSLSQTDTATTPNSIKKSWVNLADIGDKLAVNYNLQKFFSPNDVGIYPKGLIVHNNYQSNGKNNPHKSFGYLRTHEMAQIIDEFLKTEKSTFVKWFIKGFHSLKEKLNI